MIQLLEEGRWEMEKGDMVASYVTDLSANIAETGKPMRPSQRLSFSTSTTTATSMT
jgi:hypothetical protein